MEIKKMAQHIDVLLVEDDPGDVDLTKETLIDSKIAVDLHVVSDGVEALEFLRKGNAYSHAPTPDLILLDLNLPKKDGREVLMEIKNDDKLKQIPVVVLTTSDADKDIALTYGNGANCYISKPVGLEEFMTVVKAIEQFWFTIVKLPRK